MQDEKSYKLESINIKRIKRMPGIQIDASQKKIEKIAGFTKKWGQCIPVVLSESNGCMTLLSGAAVFEANLKERISKVPAVIVETDSDADDLLFALQSASLNELPDMIGISTAIVQLIDYHGIARKHIAGSMGKSKAWLAKTESLGRKLNDRVKTMVVQGEIPARTAQEVARLPPDVQTMFAISVSNEFLNKESVVYLVNRYLNKDTCEEERSRIISTPGMALPGDKKSRGVKGRDCSDSARFSHIVGRCLDSCISLLDMFNKINVNEISIRREDASKLAEYLNELSERIRKLVYPGKQ